MPQQSLMVEHRVGLERYASGTVEKVQSLLKDVQVDIERQVIKQYPWASRNPDRLRKLLGVVKEAQKEAHIVIRRDFKGDLEAIGKYEAEWAAKYYGSHSAELGVSASFNRPSAALLKSIVTSRPMQGEVLGGWSKKMERNQLERIERHIRMGVAQGEGVTEMVQRLQGTGALKFRDGQWTKDQRSAEALVRTATNHISNQAHREFGVVNGNLSGRIMHSSVLDSRTCLVAGSKIKTPYGNKSIEKIKVGELVIGGSGQPRKVLATQKSNTKKIAKVTLASGAIIYCTPDHLFLNSNQEWVEAKDLQSGEQLSQRQQSHAHIVER